MAIRLTSIVAIDRNGAIGCRNALPWRLKSDLAFFRSSTVEQTVIMGRKTYESIGGALPKRKNIVLSHNAVLHDSTDDCWWARSVDEALEKAERNRSQEVFVVGGAATYLEFAGLVDRYLVTLVDFAAPDADAYLDQAIMGDLKSWDSREIATYPIFEGRDDHPFRIVELAAPNPEERSASRSRMIADLREHVYRAKRQRSQALRAGQMATQPRFAF